MMNKNILNYVIVALVAIFVTLSGVLVLVKAKSTNPPQIAVSGQAETRVDADEIYLNLVLTDYFLEEQNGSLDVATYRTKGPNLVTIEAEALVALTKAGLPEGALSLAGAGQGSFYDRNSGQSKFYNKRTYEIKLNNFELANQLLNTPLPHRVENFSISRYSHSNLEELKVEVLGLALQNARIKANELAKGYGKVGKLLYVSDNQNNLQALARAKSDGVMATPMMEAEYSSSVAVNLQQFVIKAKVEALFSLS